MNASALFWKCVFGPWSGPKEATLAKNVCNCQRCDCDEFPVVWAEWTLKYQDPNRRWYVVQYVSNTIRMNQWKECSKMIYTCVYTNKRFMDWNVWHNNVEAFCCVQSCFWLRRSRTNQNYIIDGPETGASANASKMEHKDSIDSHQPKMSELSSLQ